MRKPVKTIKNLQKRVYVNMYIVYLLFLKNFKILRNIAKYCDNMQKITSCNPEGIIRYKLGTGVALFLFVLFRNISQYILKYFEISFKIFRKKCIPKSFERLRFFRKISHRSQFFRKIFGMQFLSKDFVYLFADVTQTQYCI